MKGIVIDAYDRQARLYPALICLIPVVAIAAGLYGTALSPNAALVAFVTSFGGVFLLMSLARDLGKRLEPSLYVSWEGKPTTQMLRHRHMMLDPVTKRRFHSFLEKHLGTPFPTAQEEASDPAAADAVYQSATQWLIGRTRDKAKFPFVFRENVNYGFRRNCLGLKPVAILVALASILWTLIASDALSTTGGISVQNVLAASIGTKVALTVDVAMLLVWTCLITKASVHRVAFAYADMLMRACDTLPKKR